MLTIVGSTEGNVIAQQWEAALRPLIVRHPSHRSEVELELEVGDPLPLRLGFHIRNCVDSTDPSKEMARFHIATSMIYIFPGTRVAQAWVATAWAGYMLHEALELVTIGDLETRAVDPHDPHPCSNGVFWRGLPNVLTASNLRQALGNAMTEEAIDRLLAGAA